MTHVSWQDRLMERYPHLFRVEGVHGRPVRTGYPAVENGWRGLIELVIARIAAVAPREGMWIERMSEKWGRLQLVVQHAASADPSVLAAVAHLVDLAEARSACSCQICGSEGALHCDAGWFVTLCKDHAKGVPVAVAPENKNLEIVRTYVGGRLRILSARRYDRTDDRFVEIDPASIELGDRE